LYEKGLTVWEEKKRGSIDSLEEGRRKALLGEGGGERMGGEKTRGILKRG